LEGPSEVLDWEPPTVPDADRPEPDALNVESALREAGAERARESAQPIPAPLERIDMGGPAGAPAFEFSSHDEQTIGDLGFKMRFVGFVMLTLAVFHGVALPIATMLAGTDWTLDLGAVFYGLIGFWTLAAGISFRDVAQTQGRDVSHLMTALTDLRRSYTLIFWLLVAACAISIGLLIWGLVRGFDVVDFSIAGRRITIH
jgi:hypothetical protein